MASNPMQMPPQPDDPGDCTEEIEELEARVSKIETMLGIKPPADEDDDKSQSEPDGLSQAIAGNANPFLKATTR